jgi:hypothetical protein
MLVQKEVLLVWGPVFSGQTRVNFNAKILKAMAAASACGSCRKKGYWGIDSSHFSGFLVIVD